MSAASRSANCSFADDRLHRALDGVCARWPASIRRWPTPRLGESREPVLLFGRLEETRRAARDLLADERRVRARCHQPFASLSAPLWAAPSRFRSPWSRQDRASSSPAPIVIAAPGTRPAGFAVDRSIRRDRSADVAAEDAGVPGRVVRVEVVHGPRHLGDRWHRLAVHPVEQAGQERFDGHLARHASKQVASACRSWSDSSRSASALSRIGCPLFAAGAASSSVLSSLYSLLSSLCSRERVRAKGQAFPFAFQSLRYRQRLRNALPSLFCLWRSRLLRLTRSATFPAHRSACVQRVSPDLRGEQPQLHELRVSGCRETKEGGVLEEAAVQLDPRRAAGAECWERGTS